MTSIMTIGKVNGVVKARARDGFVPGEEERQMMAAVMPKAGRLEYETEKKSIDGTGYHFEQYIVPTEKKEAIIRELWLFSDADKLDMDGMYLDLHTGKTFKLREAIITRENGRNFVMSPYYSEGGGTLLDFASTGTRENADGVVVTARQFK